MVQKRIFLKGGKMSIWYHSAKFVIVLYCKNMWVKFLSIVFYNAKLTQNLHLWYENGYFLKHTWKMSIWYHSAKFVIVLDCKICGSNFWALYFTMQNGPTIHNYGTKRPRLKLRLCPLKNLLKFFRKPQHGATPTVMRTFVLLEENQLKHAYAPQQRAHQSTVWHQL